MTENPKVNPEFKTICNKCFEPQNQCPCECYKECDMYPIISTAYQAGIKKALEEVEKFIRNYDNGTTLPSVMNMKSLLQQRFESLKKKLMGG